MFTGLIEELGKINSIRKGTSSAVLDISAEMASEIKIGESIAVNGVCLTAITTSNTSFQAEVMEETLQKTNLGDLKPGSGVNLERALQIGNRLDGHLVSGHVDGTGVIESISTKDIAKVIKISAGDDILRYLIPKGSIAIDGISLTLIEIEDNYFTVSLIPHTRKMTTLGIKKIGDTVNLEIDTLAKYVAKFMENITAAPDNNSDGKTDGISVDFLIKNGFI